MEHRETVTNLVRNFGEACRALVPSLDRARVSWSDANQYDNWDRIAEALFESLVVEPCRFQAGEIGLDKLQFYKYGFTASSNANAFISVAIPGTTDCKLISLVSKDQPFSHVRAIGVSGEVIAPITQCDFAFEMIDPAGKQHRLTEIDLGL
jgi:hypothetical protein